MDTISGHASTMNQVKLFADDQIAQLRADLRNLRREEHALSIIRRQVIANEPHVNTVIEGYLHPIKARLDELQESLDVWERIRAAQDYYCVVCMGYGKARIDGENGEGHIIECVACEGSGFTLAQPSLGH